MATTLDDVMAELQAVRGLLESLLAPVPAKPGKAGVISIARQIEIRRQAERDMAEKLRSKGLRRSA